jgi:hypothetical protein
MSATDRRRVLLVGGARGPSGWALDGGTGAPRDVTLDELRDVERHLQDAGDLTAAHELSQQRTRLSRIADEWRRRAEHQEAAR